MIHTIYGGQGSGKTLLLVKIALEQQKRGKNIYSNVALQGIPYTPLDYEDIINYRLYNGVVIIDEVHQLLPARASLRKVSRIICDKFLSMVRKQGLEVYGSTQTRRKVDVRFREESDYEYFCQRYVFIGGVWQLVSHGQDFDKAIPVLIKVTILEIVSGEVVESYFMGNNYYDNYDTNEIIDINVSMEKDKK